MDVEVSPEPTPEEREALIAALRALDAERPSSVPTWWRAELDDADTTGGE